jgi:glutaminyl-peptide cyclotransferase
LRVKLKCVLALAGALTVISGCGGRTASPGFDGQRAFDLLKKQCALGPRYPGSPGHKAASDLIRSELKGLADEVTSHEFTRTIGGKRLEFENIYGVFNPSASHFVLLCAHWDTRPMADQEVDPAKREKPILGANDGASGVAVLLELARAFHAKRPAVGVVMAFFDGEDYGKTSADMFIGSKEFAKNWKTAVRPKGREVTYDYGILLDMVGDSDLQICKERFSAQAAPKVVEKVWSAARRTGHGDVFLDEVRYMIDDDHLPLLAAGIKCIDVIDFDYAYWHTLDDTPDKCSPKSLQAVGEVIEKVVYEEGAPAATPATAAK